MDTITVRAVITKSCKRGWSCWTYVKYPDWPRETITTDRHETLSSVLWHLVLDSIDWKAELTTVLVKGKPMPRAEIYQRVHKALAAGSLSYKLPAIREYLFTENVTENVTNEQQI